MTTLNHVAVTVRDVDASGPWYAALFGTDPVLDEHTDGGFRHLVWAFDNGTLFGIHQHDRPLEGGGSPSSGPASTTSASAARTVRSWRPGSAG